MAFDPLKSSCVEMLRMKCEVKCRNLKWFFKRMGRGCEMKSGVCFYNPDFIVVFDAQLSLALRLRWLQNERENFMA